MKTIQTKRSISILRVMVLMFLILCSFPITAQAAENPYDFSGVDSLDKYYNYEKSKLSSDIPTLNDLEYVYMPLYNANSESETLDYYRYGAFLDNQNKLQNYLFYNLNRSTNNPMINNALTIYADPEVKFNIIDFLGNPVANSTGEYDRSKVKYYKKSTDNGHSLYYIELFASATGESTTIVQFNTDLNTTQPHYSLWFGEPVAKTGTYTCPFSISIYSPNKTSPQVSFTSPFNVPDKSWIQKVTITKTGQINPENMVGGQFTWKYPGQTTTVFDSASFVDASTVISDIFTPIAAYTAKGTFKTWIKRITWDSLIPANSLYMYQGNFTVEYFSPLGY